jgi:hypothetical protein
VQGGGTAKLTFQAGSNKLVDVPGKATAFLRCQLDRYRVETEDVRLTFGKLAYLFESDRPTIGQSPLDPTDILFKRSLGFVQKFRDYLGTINIKAEAHVYNGVMTLSFSLRVPNIDFGIFSLHNLAVSIFISIGYLGARWGIEFRVAEPANPCALTVGPFYGKAYFVFRDSIWAVLPFCPPSIDAAFEFGANINFDVIGLASLSVSISAGIHFQLNMEFAIELTGYLHCHGSMSVLGLITVGVGFDAVLTLRDHTLCCEVSLHVDIDLFLFSISVDVPVKFCFLGSTQQWLRRSVKLDRIASRSEATSGPTAATHTRFCRTDLRRRLGLLLWGFCLRLITWKNPNKRSCGQCCPMGWQKIDCACQSLLPPN